MHPLETSPIRILAVITTAFAAALSLPTGALAQTYTAKAGDSIGGGGDCQVASVPVEAFWDGTGAHWTRNASSRADRGALQADALCQTYALYNMAAYGIAQFEFTDVIFSSPSSGSIQVGLNLTIEGHSAVVNGNSFRVFLKHAGHNIGEATRAASGAITTNGDLSGWDMVGSFALVHTMTVPVNTPVSLKIYMAVGAAGSAGGHDANGRYTLRLGSLTPIPPSCEQYEVFNLPSGVTVNSATAEISNNTWAHPTPGMNYCVAAPNSVSSSGALISATGSASVSANDLVLRAGPIRVGEFGIFFHGGMQAQGPLGEGFLCASGPLVRVWPPTPADGAGFVTTVFDNTGPSGAGVMVGESRYFQLWYRDPAGGDVNGDMDADGFSLSDGLEVCFY